MTAETPTLLYISGAYSPTTTAAAIRTANFVNALVGRSVHVILLTRGREPGLEAVSPCLTLCRIGPHGRLAPQIDVRSPARWPWFSPLPGPEPADKACKAFFPAGRWLINEYKPRLVFVTAPPFPLMALAQKLAHDSHLPLVTEFRDAWYGIMPWPYKSALRRHGARVWQRRCVADASRIITVTDACRQSLIDTYGSDLADKITTVRHGFAPRDRNHQRPSVGNNSGSKDLAFTIAYTGQLRGFDLVETNMHTRLFRPLDHAWRRILLGANFCKKLRLDWMCPHYLMQAISHCCSVNSEFKRCVRLVFAGERFEQINKWACQLNLAENIKQFGPVPVAQAQQIVCDADLLVLSLYGIEGCAHHWCVPSKIYTYLGVGKPILALLPPGEARDLSLRAGTAFVAQPDDVTAIADQLLELFGQHRRGSIPIKPDWEFIRNFELARQQRRFTDVILPILHEQYAR